MELPSVRRGGTRIVFLFENHVVKIPKFFIIETIVKVFKCLPKKEVGEKLYRHDSSLPRAIAKYFLRGFKANVLDHAYHKTHAGSKGLLPTRCYLWGFVMIEPRGEDISPSDPRWRRLVKRLIKGGVREKDTLRACNFCRWNGTMRIHDCGAVQTHEALLTGLGIIERFG